MPAPGVTHSDRAGLSPRSRCSTMPRTSVLLLTVRPWSRGEGATPASRRPRAAAAGRAPGGGGPREGRAGGAEGLRGPAPSRSGFLSSARAGEAASLRCDAQCDPAAGGRGKPALRVPPSSEQAGSEPPRRAGLETSGSPEGEPRPESRRPVRTCPRSRVRGAPWGWRVGVGCAPRWRGRGTRPSSWGPCSCCSARCSDRVTPRRWLQRRLPEATLILFLFFPLGTQKKKKKNLLCFPSGNSSP